MAPLDPESDSLLTKGEASNSSPLSLHTSSATMSSPHKSSDPSSLAYEPGFTASLLDRVAESRAKFDGWVSEQRSRADAARAANDAAARRGDEEAESMRVELERIRRQIGEMDDDEEEENGNGGGARGNGESVAAKKDALLRQQAEVERSIANMHIGKRERQRELDDAAKEESSQRLRAEEVRSRKQQVSELKEQTVEDLTVGVLKYRALGLTFTRAAERNNLRFSFVQIDREDPGRAFEFTLCVNGEEEWEVDECEPPLRAGGVVRLVDELNGSGDIGRFVRGMRKEFKAIV